MQDARHISQPQGQHGRQGEDSRERSRSRDGSRLARAPRHAQESQRVERWVVLRAGLAESCGVDSWPLRVEPSDEAEVVKEVRGGERLWLRGVTENAEWLTVSSAPGSAGDVAFAARFYRELGSEFQEEAFALAGGQELQDVISASPASRSGHSKADTAKALLQELAQESFDHREFANPRAETCWLSCLFQSLWHSIVFHAVFEAYLAPAKCSPGPGERILAALQQTWVSYKDEAPGVGGKGDSSPPTRLVPPQNLVEAFGEGYGDMSDALTAIQQELSKSTDVAARAISNFIAVVPVPTLGDTWPTPEMAWRQAEQWEITSTPLIAVDLSIQNITPPCSKHLAQLWVPCSAERQNQVTNGTEDSVDGDAAEASPAASADDLGPGHRLVALVCYMPNLQHYVAFCSRQRNRVRCKFFNDLPGLTSGAPKELDWKQVPEMCHRFAFTPRLALYESVQAAEDVIGSAAGLQGRDTVHIAPLASGLFPDETPQIISDFKDDLSELGRTHNASVCLQADGSSIRICGRPEAVDSARSELQDMLQFYFPGKYASA